jgi:hypothetical protein
LHLAIRQGVPCLAAFSFKSQIMYLLYLDDAGSPGNRTEDYFVLGGVAVPEKSARWLSYEIEKLAQSTFAGSSTDPRTVEFHASEIFSGRTPPWDTISSRSARKEIILSVLNVLGSAYTSMVTFACAVHKNSFPNQDPVLKAFEDLSSRFDFFLQRISPGNSGEKGLIILDKSSYETGLQNLVSNFRMSGNKWGNQLRRIVEVPLFIDSQSSRIVQLADHVSYAVFRRYNADDLTYFNPIENRFDKSDNIMHGLVHLQLSKRDCTCPACITRREK